MNKSGVVDTEYLFLSSCGVSPLSLPAFQAEQEFSEAQRTLGSVLFSKTPSPFDALRNASAALLRVPAEDVAFIDNCAEGLNFIASGYPFEAGDEILTYVHEYPSNYYPWIEKQRFGVNVIELPNVNPTGKDFGNLPVAWSFAELRERVSAKTRIIALSHVQFCSGFAADLEALSEFCLEKQIDLVIDAAQSIGCMPVYPQKLGIAALVSSGWKWLLGPLGSAIFYTSPHFRNKLRDVWIGPNTMTQGENYLDHRWQPHASALRFEYSTKAFAASAGLAGSIEELFIPGKLESIWQEILSLQEIVRSTLDSRYAEIVNFDEKHRSGILSLRLLSADPAAVVKAMLAEKIVLSTRGGYLRIAPHFYTDGEQLKSAILALNKKLAAHY